MDDRADSSGHGTGTLILVVIFYLGGEIMDGLFKQDNVSQIAHIVGGLCGLVFGFTVRRGRR